MKYPECDDRLRVCEQYPARRTRLHLWLRRMPCPRCNAPAEGAAAAAAGRLQDEHNKEWLAQLKSGPGAPVTTPLQLPKDLNVLLMAIFPIPPPMPKPSEFCLPTASRFSDLPYWRDQAEEPRVLAEHLKDADAKEMILGGARDYDLLAERAQERDGKKSRMRLETRFSSWPLPRPDLKIAKNHFCVAKVSRFTKTK